MQWWKQKKTKQNKTKQKKQTNKTLWRALSSIHFVSLHYLSGDALWSSCLKVILPETRVRYDYEFQQQNSGFGQHDFEWNDFWVTWPVTSVDWFLIVLLYNNQWNRIILSQLVYHYANKTVISVIHSIVLGYCTSINVLMNFHLSTSLNAVNDFIAIDQQVFEFKCRIPCCILVKRGNVLVISMYIATEIEILTLT